MYMYVCVSPPPRLLITDVVMWHDMDSVMTDIVGIISRSGLRIEAHHGNQPNKNKLALYDLLLSLNELLQTAVHNVM